MNKIFVLPFGSFSKPPEVSDEFCIRRNGVRIELEEADILLPSARADIAKAIVDGGFRLWLEVVDKFGEKIGPDDFCVVSFSDPLRELFLLGARLGKWRLAVYVGEEIKIYSRDYEFLGAASFIVFGSPECETAFRKAYVLYYLGGTFSQLKDLPSKANHGTTLPDEVSVSTSNCKRVLLVSYYSGPSRTVGVKRINYWLEMLPELSGGEISVSLVTATKWDSLPANVHLVQDWGPSVLVDAQGEIPGWSGAFIEYERATSKQVSTLSYYWRLALEHYFDGLDQEFDVVIISGNPFSVFEFGAYAKRRWYAKVILDYRDPFANNPRIQYSEEARAFARYIEAGYSFPADAITVVNKVCESLVENHGDAKISVIPNGFDERAVRVSAQARSEDGLIHFVHAGSFYHNGAPEAFVASLRSDQRLHHIGELKGLESTLHQSSRLVHHGWRDYEGTLQLICECDCGVTFSSETGFETPVKVFDYLAHGLDIVVLASGDRESSALQSLLEGYEGVYWVRNSADAIEAFLADYKPPAKTRGAQLQFSRRASTEKLAKLIQELCAY